MRREVATMQTCKFVPVSAVPGIAIRKLIALVQGKRGMMVSGHRWYRARMIADARSIAAAVECARAACDSVDEQVALCVERARMASTAVVSNLVLYRLALTDRARRDACTSALVWISRRQAWMAAARTLRPKVARVPWVEVDREDGVRLSRSVRAGGVGVVSRDGFTRDGQCLARVRS